MPRPTGSPTRATTRPAGDYVSRLLEEWSREQPELDLAAAAVFERLMRITRAFEKEADALCNEFGISFSAFSVLSALRRSAPPYQLTPTELYRAGMVTSGGMTKRLIHLESEGYIDRAPARDDGRSVHVRLTRKGKRVVDEVMPQYLDLQEDFLSILAPPARRTLVQALERLLIEIEGESL